MAKRRVTYKPNHKSFGEFIKSDQVRDFTVEVANDISTEARKLAPRRKNRGVVPDGGAAMADRFEVVREAGFMKVSRSVRVKVDVINSAPSAAPNEFGGKRNKRYRMLGRAGAMFGDFKAGREGPLREDGTI